jgi:hypothetical protein
MQTIMENDSGEVLGEIIRKLAPLFERRTHFRKEVLSSISEISTRISANPPSTEEFAVFCVEIHDWLVKFDSPLRAMLLRVLRLSIMSPGELVFLHFLLHYIISALAIMSVFHLCSDTTDKSFYSVPNC